MKKPKMKNTARLRFVKKTDIAVPIENVKCIKLREHQAALVMFYQIQLSKDM